MELYYIIAITDHDRGEAMGSLYHAAGLHLLGVAQRELFPVVGVVIHSTVHPHTILA